MATTVDEDLAILNEALVHAREGHLRSFELTITTLIIRGEIQRGDFRRARADLAEYTRLLGPHPSTRERAEHQLTTALMHLGVGEPAAAIPLLEESLALRRELGDFRTAAAVLGTLSIACLRAGRVEKGLELNGERMALIGTRYMPWQRRNVRLQRARLLIELGRTEEAAAALADGLATPVPDRALKLDHLASSMVALERGDERASDRAFAAFAEEASRLAAFEPYAVFDRARQLTRHGRSDEARRLVEEIRGRLADAPGLLRMADEIVAQTTAVRA